jgi:hypothetical protein
MRRTGDEIHPSVAQRLIRPINGKDQFDRGIEPLPLKIAEHGCGDGRKVRIRNQVGNGDRVHKGHRMR